MAAGKWLGGFLGFIKAGPIGALAGFALGWAFDSLTESKTSTDSRFYQDSFTTGNANEQQYYEGQRNSFLFSLLVLSAYIIRADGKVMHSEMNMVRNFLRQNFGDAAQQQGEEILLKIFEQQKQMGAYQFQTVIQDSCRQIAVNMPEEQRLQLLNYLVMIAKADGAVAPEELQALREVTINLGLSMADLESMLNMRSSSSSEGTLEEAYKVLGISPSAKDAEVKAAYRNLALKNHPDKVAALGDDIRKAAEKKFQEINAAKDKIYKARGL